MDGRLSPWTISMDGRLSPWTFSELGQNLSQVDPSAAPSRFHTISLKFVGKSVLVIPLSGIYSATSNRSGQSQEVSPPHGLSRSVWVSGEVLRSIWDG